MIIDELLKVLEQDQDGSLLNNLYDEFRDGRNPNDILILLNSHDEIIGYGCDISCEVKVTDKTIQKEIMVRLQTIVGHNKDPYNRERAFDALYGFYLDNNDIDGLLLLCEKLKNDDIEDIKHYAVEFIEKNKK